jgi:hypothetical protein
VQTSANVDAERLHGSRDRLFALDGTGRAVEAGELAANETVMLLDHVRESGWRESNPRN